MDFKAQIQETTAALKANKLLKPGKTQIGKPVPDYVKAGNKATHFEIPESLMTFYDSVDGFHFHWKSKDGEASGELFIQNFVQTFSITWKEKLWFDWMKENESDAIEGERFRLAKSLKGFDVMDTTLDGTVIIALTTLEKGSSAEKDFPLFYWDQKGPKFPLSLTPTQYIKEGLRWKGMLGWQCFYVDWTALSSKKGLWQELFIKQKHVFLPKLESFQTLYQSLFPDDDIAQLESAFSKTKQELA